MQRDSGRAKSSAEINDVLKAAGVYNEVDRAHVQVLARAPQRDRPWGADEVTDTQVGLMIEGVRDFSRGARIS
jgi:hypothetical protein